MKCMCIQLANFAIRSLDSAECTDCVCACMHHPSAYMWVRHCPLLVYWLHVYVQSYFPSNEKLLLMVIGCEELHFEVKSGVFP